MNFTETPEATSAALGSGATLHCATNGRVERCAWLWRPLTAAPDAEPTALREFPSHGDLGRNCSLSLPSVSLDDQGYWTCQVYLAGLSTLMSPPPAKLTVYEEGESRVAARSLFLAPELRRKCVELRISVCRQFYFCLLKTH